MISIDIQIHGYHRGHQLLASSIVLSKDDQAVVDRLSDVAGPLRPKEQFEPYLTTYPLPSGTYYVIARTWQDHSVPRAGCVRTKSLLLNAKIWAQKPPLSAILELLSSSELPIEAEAIRTEREEPLELLLPPVSNFNASELLEALFLEEPKPIVAFDVPDPELIALHLLAALWPNLRLKFALSTFALSPRKIMGRDLDLVFSPSNAKARFSDWPGRRMDGRLPQPARHRWTEVIVRRIFEESTPRLLSDDTINLLGDRGAESVSVLRIALLWDELLAKLDQTPTAALGLLDIANSRMVNSSKAMKLLEPGLVEATRQVGSNLSHKDAWEFVGAITRKMEGTKLLAGKIAVNNLAEYLAEQAPDGILNLLQQFDPDSVFNELIPSIAIGLGNGSWSTVKPVLLNVPMEIFAHLVSQSGGLISQIVGDDELIEITGIMLTEVDQHLSSKVGKVLLPFLIEDRQLPAAQPIISRLDSKEVTAELCWLRDVNDFQAEQLSALLIRRAYEVGGLRDVRDLLIMSDTSTRANTLLTLTIDPVVADVLWLLNEKKLSKTASSVLFENVLQRADERQFKELLSDRIIAESIVSHLPDDANDILIRAALQDCLPMNTYICVIQSALSKVDKVQRFEIAAYAIKRCLRNRFKGDEIAVLSMLLGIIGTQLDGRWAVREGLDRNIDADVASRNLIVFEKAPSAARQRIVEVVDEIARILQRRRAVNLGEDANDACARLMFDAENTSRAALIDAASILIPSLLNARRQPVSLMIAALFPIVYQELARSSNVPERLNIFFFFDWDRCKTARNELVEAFMSSSWKAGDLALTACRCNDITKILKHVAKSYGGEEYLIRIENDLDKLDTDSQRFVTRSIEEILNK